MNIKNKGLVGTLVLEGFNNLKSVDASYNKLENFYVPVNDAPFLEEINLSNNSLEKLNMEENNVIKKLWINDNNLKNLDTKYLDKLEYLNISIRY